MPDSSEIRTERDTRLIRYGFVASAETLRSSYQDWIQEEIKDCITKAQLAQLTCDNARDKEKLDGIERRSQEINIEISVKLERELKDKCAEIDGIVWDGDDILEPRSELEPIFLKCDALVREIIKIRKYLDIYIRPD